jgi:uracil-DNA glycosylase
MPNLHSNSYNISENSKIDSIILKIEDSWKAVLEDEFKKQYFHDLKTFLCEERRKYVVYPDVKNIFNAFAHTPFDSLKAVILGQDPYHGPGQAHGLSFSVPDGIKPPPSLARIFKEIHADLGIPIPQTGNLEHWADQGVLLLNATLTVRANEAGTHQKKGWEFFTDSVIKHISEQKTGIIFLLWGNYAQAKEQLIDSSKHFILKAAHPSPLARTGFFGCNHFSKTNDILFKQGLAPIDWEIKKSQFELF